MEGMGRSFGVGEPAFITSMRVVVASLSLVALMSWAASLKVRISTTNTATGRVRLEGDALKLDNAERTGSVLGMGSMVDDAAEASSRGVVIEAAVGSEIASEEVDS